MLWNVRSLRIFFHHIFCWRICSVVSLVLPRRLSCLLQKWKDVVRDDNVTMATITQTMVTTGRNTVHKHIYELGFLSSVYCFLCEFVCLLCIYYVCRRIVARELPMKIVRGGGVKKAIKCEMRRRQQECGDNNRVFIYLNFSRSYKISTHT